MRGRFVAVLVLGLGVVAPLGCSLLVDTRGLVGPGGADSSAGSDVTLGGDSQSPADARSDAPQPDAAPPDATSRWCVARDASVCEDFDDPAPLANTGWTTGQRGSAVFSKRADLDAASPPSVGYMSAQLGSGYEWANIRKKLAVSPTKVTVACDVRIDVLTAQFADLTTLLLVDGAGREYYIQVGVSPTSLVLEEYWDTADGGTSTVAAPAQAAPALGKWVRYQLQLDKSAATVSLAVDGRVVASRAMAAAPAAASGKLELLVGIVWVDGPGALAAAVDNVLLTYE